MSNLTLKQAENLVKQNEQASIYRVYSRSRYITELQPKILYSLEVTGHDGKSASCYPIHESTALYLSEKYKRPIR